MFATANPAQGRVRTTIHTVKPENIATFLERKRHGLYQDDMGNNLNIRIESCS